MLLVLLVLVGGGRFGWPLWRARRANFRELRQPLFQFVVPQASSRILVLAPHCDDETLGCGGLIAQALHNGAAVKVVLVTNGDGFHYAAARWFEEVKVSPLGKILAGRHAGGDDPEG